MAATISHGDVPSIEGRADAAGTARTVAPPSVQRVLSGADAALDPGLANEFGQRLEHDFSNVRIHTDARAALSAHDLDADAYTVGHHLVFAGGRYAPASAPGRQLIAHELAHVVQQRAGGSSLAGVVQRHPAEEARPGGYMWVPFDDDGGWDAAAILMHMSQLEDTDTPIPAHLPGGEDPVAVEQSDRKRCGMNASLAAAIAAGPMRVIDLCKNLRKRIEEYRKRGAKGEAEMPTARLSDEATNSVSRILRDVYYGTVGMAKEGSGGTLQYRDLDMLAHWLYVFAYNPDDPGRVAGRGGVGDFQGGGRRWRSPEEIADAAAMAGYTLGTGWMELGTWDTLMLWANGLADGDSMLVLISNDPHAENAVYKHTITFFRQGSTLYVHNPWGAGRVYPSTDPKFKESVHGAYDEEGGLKPLGLIAPKLGPESFLPSPALELSH